MTDDFIWIVTNDHLAASLSEKRLLDKIGLKQVTVDPIKLEPEHYKIFQTVGKLLAQAEQEVGNDSNPKLDEVPLALEINSKNQLLRRAFYSEHFLLTNP